MNIVLKPGRYIVAVSGGVDSMALLHALQNLPDVKLTVAHFNHGIRPDAREDVVLVRSTAKKYNLPFVFAEGKLGPGSSEEAARKARYEFLKKVMQASAAQAIITAHHKDDVLETAIINLKRGTGRKGLSSLKSIDGIKRPMLHHTKNDIYTYAKKHNLDWREDGTNTDTKYLRNHIRHNVLAKVSASDTAALHQIIQKSHVINAAIDELIHEYLQCYSYGNRLKRHEFTMLPHKVALEVMAEWLRMHKIQNFDKKLLERLTHAAKIHTVGKEIPISDTYNLKINREFLALHYIER